jgi:hypothetical protein
LTDRLARVGRRLATPNVERGIVEAQSGRVARAGGNLFARHVNYEQEGRTVNFNPEKHRADQDKVLADLREEFKLLPNLPQISTVHTIALAIDEAGADADYIICCHDEANDCKHHIAYPHSNVNTEGPPDAERGRISGHVKRVISAAYN